MGKNIRVCLWTILVLYCLASILYRDISDIFPTERERSDTKYITIHHTDTEREPTVGEVDYYHRQCNGWGSGFAYHIYIQGWRIQKVHDLDAATGHALSHNFDAVAVCVAGDFDTQEPSPIQIAELWITVRILQWIYPDAELTTHSDLNATSCCGENLKKHVEKWKKRELPQ